MKRLIATTLLTMMLLVFAAMGANAATGDVVAHQGNDVAWVNTSANRTINVDDRECDGNPVRAKYFSTDGTYEHGPFYVKDEGGCSDGSVSEVVPYGTVIEKFKVGEQTNDGAWHYGDYAWAFIAT